MFKLICASALLVTTAAVAQARNEAPAKDSIENPDERVCVDQPTTGSRVNKIRVCRTRAEWAALRAQNSKSGERSRNRRGDN